MLTTIEYEKVRMALLAVVDAAHYEFHCTPATIFSIMGDIAEEALAQDFNDESSTTSD